MKFVLAAVLLLAAIVEGEEKPATVIVPDSSSSSSPILTALSQNSMESLKIRLRDIQALTFKAGKLATRQRTTPLQQLNCISGCFGELPTSAQCENKGFDGAGVNWECRANVQRGRKLENTKVRCEAFTEGDREYILAGSCILDYGLGGRPSGGGSRKGITPAYYPSDSHSKSPLSFIVPIIIIIILVVVVCAIAKACRRSSESSGVVMGAPPGQPGGYYGGGGGAYPAQPGFNPGYGQPGYVAPMAAPMAAPSRGGSGLGAGLGGFAAGAATGGLLGYMMGNHGNSGYGHSGYGTYGGGMVGGGGGGDYNAGDMGGGGGYEMSTDFADTGLE